MKSPFNTTVAGPETSASARCRIYFSASRLPYMPPTAYSTDARTTGARRLAKPAPLSPGRRLAPMTLLPSSLLVRDPASTVRSTSKRSAATAAQPRSLDRNRRFPCAVFLSRKSMRPSGLAFRTIMLPAGGLALGADLSRSCSDGSSCGRPCRRAFANFGKPMD